MQPAYLPPHASSACFLKESQAVVSLVIDYTDALDRPMPKYKWVTQQEKSETKLPPSPDL